MRTGEPAVRNNTRGGRAAIPLKVRTLMAKGVVIPNPYSVEIGNEVDPERISGTRVVFYPGTRISGPDTLISPGVRLGYEAPVTAVDCLIGPETDLRGGFFQSSVFLAQVKFASGAQIREGCLLEEGVRAGHTAGLKQTILFPFVTLGSLINFCDCLMAGGTDEKNHSEVGSSFIHFNYTPNQDKATPSLIGDVPRGVMLREKVIFLGGQGGIVGPARIGYGVISAAGTIIRKDCPEGAFIPPGDREGKSPYRRGGYGALARIVCNNLVYLANLLALRQWYLQVRSLFFPSYFHGDKLLAGALKVLDENISERIRRMSDLARRLPTPGDGEPADSSQGELLRIQKRELKENWEKIAALITGGGEGKIGLEDRELFLTGIETLRQGKGDYLAVIRGLPPEMVSIGSKWLGCIVEKLLVDAGKILPACQGENGFNSNGYLPGLK